MTGTNRERHTLPGVPLFCAPMSYDAAKHDRVINGGSVKWERLRLLGSPARIFLGGAAIAGGAFLIYVPAGLIAVGLTLWLIDFLSGDDGDRTATRAP
jgi:hypothetical protein